MAFTKAVKGKKPVRIVIGGPSGAGKTFTAQTFAKRLSEVTGKRTAAVDTEFYRMSLYADKFDFDVNDFNPPFNPKALIDAIHDAEKDGYGQFIVDSWTHFYSMEGGLLEIVQDAAKSKGGNQYAGWAKGTPLQNLLVDTIIRSPMHMIFCIRAKQGYVEAEKNGKKTYEKVGMELIQRDGATFDFDFVLMMDMENGALVDKGMAYLTTGEYVRKPDASTVDLIIKSITENATNEVAVPAVKYVEPKPEEVIKAMQTGIIEKIKTLGGSANETLMSTLKKYHESCNPNKIKDVEQLKKLDVELDDMAAIAEKENK